MTNPTNRPDSTTGTPACPCSRMTSIAAPTDADPATGAGAGVIKSATVRGGSLIDSGYAHTNFRRDPRLSLHPGHHHLYKYHRALIDRAPPLKRMDLRIEHACPTWVSRPVVPGTSLNGSIRADTSTEILRTRGRGRRVDRALVIDNRSHSPYTLEYPYTHSTRCSHLRLNYCQETMPPVRTDDAAADFRATREEGR